MALTKVSTDGVKDDAITKTKIPANQIEASELANNAVTQDKIGSLAVVSTKLAPDAVTDAKLSDHASDNSLRAVGTNHIKDEAVTLAKLPHGDANNDGKFLRANNGADPSFETVSIPAGTTINNNADNRVITGSGTANTLNGESLVTVDSNGRMTIGLTVGGVCLTASSAGSTYGGALRLINTISSNHEWTIAVGGGDNAYVAGRGLLFRDETTGINHSQLQTNGNIRIVDGDLQVASGHGIDFNPDANATGASSEVLDDYEEGTWTPQVHDGTISYNNAYYTKIGRKVTVLARIYNFSDNSTNDGVRIQNLPFAATINDTAVGSVMYSYGGQQHATVLYMNSSNNGQLMIYGGHSGSFDNLRHNELNVSSGSTDMYLCATYFTST